MAESLPYFGYGSNLDADDWKEWCERKAMTMWKWLKLETPT